MAQRPQEGDPPSFTSQKEGHPPSFDWAFLTGVYDDLARLHFDDRYRWVGRDANVLLHRLLGRLVRQYLREQDPGWERDFWVMHEFTKARGVQLRLFAKWSTAQRLLDELIDKHREAADAGT
jgi:hypothetical protein